MKNSICTLLLLSLAYYIYGKDISSTTALIVARNHLETVGTKNMSNGVVYHTEEGTNGVQYYIINNSSGWVIVAGDSNTEPILAFSETGSFNISREHPANMYLKSYKHLVDRNRGNNIDEEIKSEWDNLLNNNLNNGKVELHDYLLKGEEGEYLWHQWSPFNDNIGDDYPVGCAPVAVGMLLKYWEWPNSRSSASIPFENRFDLMPTQYPTTEEQKTEVAAFMKYLSWKLDTFYILNPLTGSKYGATYLSDVRDGLPDLGIKGAQAFEYGQGTNITIWRQMIEGEIRCKRPILYYGGDDIFGFHYYIVDGYGYNNKFHVNWGWGNRTVENPVAGSNGWYSYEGADGFDDYWLDQCMFIGFSPSYYDIEEYSQVDIETSDFNESKILSLTGNKSTDAGLYEQKLYIGQDLITLKYPLHFKAESNQKLKACLKKPDVQVQSYPIDVYNYAFPNPTDNHIKCKTKGGNLVVMRMFQGSTYLKGKAVSYSTVRTDWEIEQLLWTTNQYSGTGFFLEIYVFNSVGQKRHETLQFRIVD